MTDTTPMRLTLNISAPLLKTLVIAQDLKQGAAVLITDRIEIEGPTTIRLIPCDPLHAQVALSGVRQGQIRAATTFAELAQLGAIAETVGRGISCLSEGLLQCASSMSQLSERQLAILKLLARGTSNELIAERAHMSMSTLKRELRLLRRVTGCHDRTSFVDRLALSVGEHEGFVDGGTCGHSHHCCPIHRGGQQENSHQCESSHACSVLFMHTSDRNDCVPTYQGEI